MDIHKIDWSSIPWEAVRKGVGRKAFSGNGATLALNRLEPGYEPAPHSHPHEQIVYIIQGTMKLHVGDQAHILSAGGLAVVPSNVTHWGEVVGSEVVLNLDVFTPKRAEYAA
jgi:quercetin dioxygenase-like cupin family protein